MKNKTLHIENFGPITDATVKLRAFNLFIGEQAIGKSTMAKLITIFTDYISLCKLINGGMGFWKICLREYGLDIYAADNYKISYVMENENQSFHLKIENKAIVCFMLKDGKKITNRTSIFNSLIDLKPIYHSEELYKKIQEGEKSGVKKEDLLELFKNSLYIPAERIIYSVLTNLMPALYLSKSAVPQILLRFMVELNNAKAEYPKLPIGLLNIDFKYEAGEDSIVLEGDDKTIPLNVASSGIQSLVPLMLVLHYAIDKREYSSYVIEEPECNLFPTKQVELLKEILKKVMHPSRTLTITTHSPYLLSAINNLLFSGLIVEKYGEAMKNYIDEIVPPEYRLSASECSVYSLGESINGGVYCRSLMDEETGMIDFNSLDAVSEELSIEFDALQDAVMKLDSED